MSLIDDLSEYLRDIAALAWVSGHDDYEDRIDEAADSLIELQRENVQLRAKVRELAKMCDDVECASGDPGGEDTGWCPFCGYWPPTDGHAPDCRLITADIAGLLGKEQS